MNFLLKIETRCIVWQKAICTIMKIVGKHVPFILTLCGEWVYVLNRLQQIYQIMESPDDTNELEFSYQVGKIISQLEIYDQVWVARDLGNAVRIEERFHSKNGIELAGKIVGVLLEDEGCAERFPYDVVDELKKEFGI